VRTRRWNREEQVLSIARDVWRYLTDAVIEEELALEAGAILDMRAAEVRDLGRVQFVLSEQVHELLRTMPRLVRRLTTTTELEEEISPERVRGAIRWGPTLSERMATGLPHLYVTSPARRAFQTAENEVLVAALEAIQSAARATGWMRSSSSGIGAKVRRRGSDAERWLRHRMLTEVERRPLTPQIRSRVRTGRASRRYRPALDVLDLHAQYLKRHDREAVKRAVERHALLVATEDKLLELKVAFSIERGLRELGWRLGHPGLIRDRRLCHATQGSRVVDVYYQSTPKALSAGSHYREIQREHPFRGIGGMIPDFVLRIDGLRGRRWVLVEVKGVESSVHNHARNAIRGLLAYRRAFDPVLSEQPGPYGLAVAWGSDLEPSARSEIAACTPDTVHKALGFMLESS
jgi:hypothetical protein